MSTNERTHPVEGGQGVWQIRVKPTPVGYVLKRALVGTHVYDLYSGIVVTSTQHEREIQALTHETFPAQDVRRGIPREPS